MANWSDLKAAVASIVKTNGNKEITGQLLQNVLNNIISNVGLNPSFAGIATPETNPGTPDGNVFYLATTAGTYSNFNGIVINSGEAVILEWKGSWVKKDSGFATKENLSELGSYYISNKNLTDQMSQGANIIHGKIGEVLSIENSNDGSFRNIKISIEFGNTFVLSGTGAGRSYVTSGYVTDNLTTSVVTGYYSYSSTSVGTATTANKTTDGGWSCIAQPVKAGDKVTITGVGGAGARLYCLVNNDGIIKAIAPPGDSQTGFILNVDEDGILYCSFDYSSVFSVVREYKVFKEGTSRGNWINGSYEFGRTCNCDYTAPSISPYSFPTTGKVAHINGLYDALVAAYPKYVFKEDCDSVMKAMGVEKPSAIANLPMYMYKFMPPKAPNSSAYTATNSEANMIKAFVITGTHNEYIAVWDCYNAMRLICESWDEDKNLEELRWNAEIYVIPCYNLHGVENSIRTNERGVDLNRNAPTLDWKVQGSLGDSTYSGEAAGSEYSTKVMMYYLQTIKPQIFIDHHNTNVGAGTDEGDGKNMMYSHSVNQIILDISSVMFSQMTRKWKKRYTNIFPSVEADSTTIFGYTLYDHINGSIGRYGSEQGALGSTFETNFGILYKNGEYSTANRQNNTEVVATCATEGFVNYLLRCLTACSSQVGILG